MTDKEKISRHAATDRDKCQEIADKYGWELIIKFSKLILGQQTRVFTNYQIIC
ncbi:hypothetical protein [Dolichospermum compactum]|uniref:Uncharacterized protein n=1 Tax=Dolichospermum compactum NIES-806 TaxID=1973481 RepID=A0A1Z4UY58_9CYAN|nr:hypothetical protein [Dolichospermum compactum]BAZ84187.1 hypothetical protein NIES806_03710 [Dolichospermum compactum NIES-806]